MNERDEINDGSMLTPAGQTVDGIEVRPLTLATAAVLRRLQNPLYLAMMAGEDVQDFSPEAEDILQYIWVHAAPWEDVKRLAVSAPYRKEEVAAAVLDFGLSIHPAQLPAFMAVITGAATAVQAATAEALPDELTGDASKN